MFYVIQFSLCAESSNAIALFVKGQRICYLDEPSNHASLSNAAEWFEDGIREYGGPVIAISYDRRSVHNFVGESTTLISSPSVREGIAGL